MQVVAETAAILAGLLASSCGVALVLRRMAGAIDLPSGPGAVLAACGVGLLLIAIGDLASGQARGPEARSGLSRLPAVLTRLGLMLALAALVLPLGRAPLGATLPALAALILSLAMAARRPTAAALRLVRDRRWRPLRSGVDGRTPRPEPGAALSPPMRPSAAADAPAAFVAAQAAPPAGSLLQRFERFGTADGGEMVRGRICIVVPEGARSGSGHVGFCPPFAAVPAVEATTDYDGVEAVVTAAEVLPWGVRVECRLDEPAEEPIEIPVDLLAKLPA